MKHFGREDRSDILLFHVEIIGRDMKSKAIEVQNRLDQKLR